ncbi:MAG TPA: ABC transporter permease subunit, partial [Verrucomicrobiae bacterium]
MTFLPIVERELRAAARRPVTHWLRLGVALLGFAATLLVLSNSRRMGNSVQVGSAIFTAISISALGFCLMAGPFLTADTLTSEKREGTLGLLFLTDLRPFDIISGKLAAASLNALLVFLSTVPLLMLPVLWGGVSLKQVLLTALSLALALGVSLAIGVFYSTVCRHHRLALLATLTTVLLLGGLPFLVLATECSLRGSTAAFSLGCLFVSPVALFVEALQGSRLFRTAPPMLPVGVVFQTAIILTAGMAACRWLPRV